MSNKIPKILLLHAHDKESRELAKSAYTSAYDFRELAVKYLQAKKHRVEVEQRSKKSYELPAWAEFQADSNATIRTIEEMLREVFGIGGIHGNDEVQENRRGQKENKATEESS